MNKKKALRRFFTMDVHNHEGFTLVELIIVIAILAILSGVAVAGYSAYIKKANKAADDAMIQQINQAFRTACIDKNLDYFDLDGKAKATVTDGTLGAVTVTGVDGFNDVFQNYLGETTIVFKYYKALNYKAEIGGFVGKEDYLAGTDYEGKEQVLHQAFDGIAGYFAGMINLGITGDKLEASLDNVSDELMTALNLQGMVNGLNSALDMDDAELKVYLEGLGYDFDSLTPEELVNVRANLSVLYFAEQARTADLAKVKSSVENFRSLLLTGYKNAGSVTDTQLEEYYLSTRSEKDKVWYEGLDDEGKAETLDKFRRGTQADLGDLKLNGAQLTAMSMAVDPQTMGQNEAGINMLGALYALSVGFYESEYYQGEPDKIPSYSEFACVMGAMSNANYDTYYAAKGEDNLKAYLGYMGDLDAKSVDLTKPDAFGSIVN